MSPTFNPDDNTDDEPDLEDPDDCKVDLAHLAARVDAATQHDVDTLAAATATQDKKEQQSFEAQERRSTAELAFLMRDRK